MKIIAGLGNPGKKYKNTRHNVGFMALDFVIQKLGLEWKMNKKLNVLVCKNKGVIYLKPQIFMNDSGRVIEEILSYYKLIPKKFGVLKEKNSDLREILILIHDDIDIELGKIKESAGSRSAGHKGVQSVIDCLKTKNFKRIRVGIKTERLNNVPAQNFVLEKFNSEELAVINKIIKDRIASKLI